MKRYLIVLSLLLTLILAMPVAAARSFADVPEDIWYAASVEKLTDLNIISGYEDNTFRPQNSITRAEFTKLLAGLSGDDVSGLTTYAFTDVDPALWYARYIAWAVNEGVVGGMGDGTFAPNAPITRQQMAVMLDRYAEKVDRIDLPVSKDAVSFTDHSRIATWAADAVRVMQRAGVINGYVDGSFGPEGKATRAETAQLLTNYMAAAEQGTDNGYTPPVTEKTTITGRYGSQGEALVPARQAFELLGYSLLYFAESGLTVADNGASDVIFWRDKSDAYARGNKLTGKISPAGNIGGSMWVSVRVLGAAGGNISVADDGGTPLVSIGKVSNSGTNLMTLSQTGNAFYGSSDQQAANGIINSRTNTGVYHGNVANGVWRGYGRYVSTNLGLRYYGEWSGGLMNGYGRLILRHGEVCVGSFENGIFKNGSYYFADGSVFTGSMTSANMYPTGDGSYTAANGSVYSGDWGSYGAIVVRK